RTIFGGAAARAHVGACSDENLNVGIRADDGADVPAIENGPRRGCSKLALERKQGGTNFRNGGHNRCGFPDSMSFENAFVKSGRSEPLGRSDRSFRIVWRVPAIDESFRDRTIDQAGVQMPQVIVGGKFLAERPFARRRRPVDRDNHARSAPIERISSVKPGKLVAMNPLSSIRTGFSMATPMMRADIAIR